MSKKSTVVAVLASLAASLASSNIVLAQSVRDYVYVVGSSTVYPFSTIVAERFGRNTRFKTPKVESTGSGGGLRLFCDGVGVGLPDIVNSSRRILDSEMRHCRDSGVQDVVEVKIGYDGIVLANAVQAPHLDVSSHELYLALARYLPGDAEGAIEENPHERWSDVRPGLPDMPIEVFGPPPTSGTRDAFVAAVFDQSCRRVEWLDRLANDDPADFIRLCHSVREDGRFIEAGENDNLIVQKLQGNPQAFGILGFSFLDQNGEKVQGATIDGVRPTFEDIATSAYALSRPLFFYVKKAHVNLIPGLREYLLEFTSERTWGDEGYLSYRGLVPLPEDERRRIAATVSELRVLQLALE